MQKFFVILFLMLFGTPVFAAGTFTLSSPQLKAGSTISNEHVFNNFGCEGDNIPPALNWSNAPKGTKSFAITMYDPNAPTGSGWWHWVIFDIPATATSIPLNAGLSANKSLPIATLPEGAIESLTDFGQPGFGGACPPKGDPKHPYTFTIHALDVEHLDVPATSTPAFVGYNLTAHRLGKAEFTVYYGR